MSRVMGAALRGVEGVPVEVEVRISSQLPKVVMVGLPEAAVRESGARVRAAIGAAGERFPDRRVTVNLAPAGFPKSGAGLDLPIAIGVLAAAGVVPADATARLGLFGELALDGRVRGVRGGLALALALRDAGVRTIAVAPANAAEAALAPGLDVRVAKDLPALLGALRGGDPLPEAQVAAAPVPPHPPDLAEVRGQERARRALEIAAAGGHALLLQGPPGAGKTMLARRLPGLLPPLDEEEALEVTRIHGVAGAGGGIARLRPFRAPHHSATLAGLLGGGAPPRPGEATLAHRGVLFLDELAEFERRALEALRQVLEEKRVMLARARGTAVLPAAFQLVAAANPCPCGWRLSRVRSCRCDDGAAARYAARLSGPLLDRIDLHAGVPALRWRELGAEASGESSAEVRARVMTARARQRERLARHGVASNAELPPAALDGVIRAHPEARRLLAQAVDRLGLSARGAHRALRVARSIADLDGEKRVGPAAVAEALSYRSAAERLS